MQPIPTNNNEQLENDNQLPGTHNNQQQRHPIINSYHSTTHNSEQLPPTGTPDKNDHPTTDSHQIVS